MRNPDHSFFLPLWPSGAPTTLDKPRAALDSLLTEFRRDVAAVYADKYLNEAGRQLKLGGLRERLRPVLTELATRVDPARFVYRQRAQELDGKGCDDAGWGSELRRREVRDALAHMTGEDRYLAIEAAMRDGDIETMQAIMQTPKVRTDVVTSEQRERVRRELWRAADPDTASSQERLADQIPVYEETLRMAHEQMVRLASGREQDFKAFEGNARATAGFREWWQTRTGEPDDTNEQTADDASALPEEKAVA
jgi:hypothetical protein